MEATSLSLFYTVKCHIINIIIIIIIIIGQGSIKVLYIQKRAIQVRLSHSSLIDEGRTKVLVDDRKRKDSGIHHDTSMIDQGNTEAFFNDRLRNTKEYIHHRSREH